MALSKQARLRQVAKRLDDANARREALYDSRLKLMRELRADGLTHADIAALAGVTPMAVAKQLDKPVAAGSNGRSRR